MKGIDVSKYQKQIDWAKVDTSGIDFALIRIGMGNDAKQVDPYYRQNVDQALAHGLYVGGYYFGYATSTADAEKEADVCLALLEPYRGKLLFPIAYDYEYDSANYFKRVKGRLPTNAEIDSFACAFCGRLKSYGWFANIYTNIDFYRSGKFKTAITKHDVWLADYSGGPDYPCYIQQTSSKSRVPGINGNVDMDVSFRDYPAYIRAGGYNGYPNPALTAVQIDTTTGVTFPYGGMYTVKTTSAETPELYAGTDNVVIVKHCRREGQNDFWHLIFVGKPGQAAGIFTRYPNEQPVKRFVAYVK